MTSVSLKSRKTINQDLNNVDWAVKPHLYQSFNITLILMDKWPYDGVVETTLYIFLEINLTEAPEHVTKKMP